MYVMCHRTHRERESAKKCKQIGILHDNNGKKWHEKVQAKKLCKNLE